MNRSSGERRSTGPAGALLLRGPLTARLSRVSFLKYAENAFPLAGGSAGSPPLGCPTVTTSVPVTSRQVTAAAAAAAELKEPFDPPEGLHIVTPRRAPSHGKTSMASDNNSRRRSLVVEMELLTRTLHTKLIKTKQQLHLHDKYLTF
ncbi:hypothetical protein EYF80_033059 [Liparis tanakae]|uniref:Uncharacterized protein n=1 Tax=Liparis tanakae TaxID=230148 RepID=A0A4Z2GVX0_9TELE|nr:hypothetical protein EYF80_033059 [Liparis tanakae]